MGVICALAVVGSRGSPVIDTNCERVWALLYPAGRWKVCGMGSPGGKIRARGGGRPKGKDTPGILRRQLCSFLGWVGSGATTVGTPRVAGQGRGPVLGWWCVPGAGRHRLGEGLGNAVSRWHTDGVLSSDGQPRGAGPGVAAERGDPRRRRSSCSGRLEGWAVPGAAPAGWALALPPRGVGQRALYLRAAGDASQRSDQVPAGGGRRKGRARRKRRAPSA